MQLSVPVSAKPCPAGAPPQDPIFAAIERCKAAIVAFDAAVGVEQDLECELPEAVRRSDVVGRLVRSDDPRWLAAIRNWRRSHVELDAAKFALLDTKPSTMEGMAAVMAYIGEVESVEQFFPDSGALHSGATMGDFLLSLSKLCAKLHKAPPITKH